MSIIKEIQVGDGSHDHPQSVVKTMDELKSAFNNLAIKTYKSLVAERKFTLSFLRSRFDSFPCTCLHEHKEFLDEYLLKMECEITADGLWSQLSSYWNFLNCDLLKFIIGTVGRSSLVEEMDSYEADLIKFCEEAEMYSPDQSKGIKPANSKELSIRISDECNKLKLIQIKGLGKVFTAAFKLPQVCGFLLKCVSDSGAVTWSVPVHYCKMLRWKLSICDEQFFEKHDIKNVSLNGEECYCKGSDRTTVNPANEIAAKTAITKKVFEVEDMMKKVLVSSPPFTVTQLCTAYVCKMLTQYLSTHPVYGGKGMQIRAISDLPQDVQSVYSDVCWQAYYYFTLFDYDGEYDPVDPLGLGTRLDSDQIDFFHYKLQQYLAADYQVAYDRQMEYSEGLMELNSEYYPYFVAGHARKDFTTSVWEEHWSTERFNMSLLLYEARSPSLIASTFHDQKLCYDPHNFSLGYGSSDTLQQLVNAYTFGYVVYFYSAFCRIPESISLDGFVRGLLAASEYVFDGKYPLVSLELEMAVYCNTSDLNGFTSMPHSILNQVTTLSLLRHPGSYGSKKMTEDYATATQTEAIADILEHHSKSLVELKLSMFGKSIWDEAVTRSLRSNTTLMLLKIEGNVIFECTSGLWENDLINLTELDFNSCGIGDRAAIEIASMLRVNKSLKKLTLHDNRGSISAGCVEAVAEALQVNKSLKVLHLNQCRIVDLGADELGKMLSSNQSLESLSLFNNLINDDGVKALSEGLTSNNVLAELNLSSNMITDITALAGALEVNKTLKILDISENSVYNVSALAKSLEVNSTLTKLNLSGNELDDESSQVLADSLLVNKTLEILNCSENRKMSFSSANFFSSILSHNETLQEITLPQEVRAKITKEQDPRMMFA